MNEVTRAAVVRAPIRRVGLAVAPHLPFDLRELLLRLRVARRETIAFAVRWSGLPLLARATWGKRRVAILVYHNPDPETVDRHLRYLTRHYSVVTLDELVDALRSGNWERLPDRSVVLTIDDGHAGNARLLDVLERHDVRATLFACTQIIDTARAFWFVLPEPRLRSRLFEVPNAERLQVLEREFGFSQFSDQGGERQALDAAELAALAARVDVQAHTRFHPILTRCTDEECTAEIVGSKSDVEQRTGRECRHFSYPNGCYGDRESALVREAGFSSARTIETGWTTRASDPYRLPVLGMPDDASLNLVAAQLTGLPYVRELMYR